VVAAECDDVVHGQVCLGRCAHKHALERW
jgi:hypothetical protein